MACDMGKASTPTRARRALRPVPAVPVFSLVFLKRSNVIDPWQFWRLFVFASSEFQRTIKDLQVSRVSKSHRSTKETGFGDNATAVEFVHSQPRPVFVQPDLTSQLCRCQERRHPNGWNLEGHTAALSCHEQWTILVTIWIDSAQWVLRCFQCDPNPSSS